MGKFLLNKSDETLQPEATHTPGFFKDQSQQTVTPAPGGWMVSARAFAGMMGSAHG